MMGTVRGVDEAIVTKYYEWCGVMLVDQNSNQCSFPGKKMENGAGRECESVMGSHVRLLCLPAWPGWLGLWPTQAGSNNQ